MAGVTITPSPIGYMAPGGLRGKSVLTIEVVISWVPPLALLGLGLGFLLPMKEFIIRCASISF